MNRGGRALMNRLAAVAAAALAPVALAACGSSGSKVGLSRNEPSVARNGPIAYERFAGDGDDGRTAQLYVRQPDGTTRRITDIKGGAFNPAWSFDGSRIAFESGASVARPGLASAITPDAAAAAGGRQIFTIAADGSHLHRLTDSCAGTKACKADVAPAWSPDGRNIAFFRVRGPFVNKGVRYEPLLLATSIDLVVIGSDGSDERVVERWGLDPQPGVGAPAWSPDGKQIAVALGSLHHPTKHASYNAAIHVVPAAGGAAHRISPWAIGAGNPSWSRDGRHVAFNSFGGHTPYLYVVDPDGRHLKPVVRPNRIRNHIGWVDAPVWSPDGRQIAFGTGTAPCDFARHPLCRRDPDFTPLDIYVIGADGFGLRRLTSASQFESHPAWAPAR
jgi:Tol biopolymer transport system component